MPKWSSKSIYKTISGDLSASTGRYFERKLLPYLRLIWPTMIQPPAMRNWDQKGIDLLTWEDSGPFKCVIQCKGFEVQTLGNSQKSQALASIRKFHKSGVQAENYFLIHNRDGRNPQFREEIENELKILEETGQVKKAELWDRQIFLNNVFDRMKVVIENNLQILNLKLKDRYKNLFRFGYLFIEAVPATEKRLVFKKYQPCDVEVIKFNKHINLKDLVLSSSGNEWSLLTGSFGVGKTTAALNIATTSDRTTVFLQASTLIDSVKIQSGTNLLLAHFLEALNVFNGQYIEEDLEVLHRFAGSVMSHILQDGKSKYLLIIDGLDENRIFADFEGLQRLHNQLSDFTCPIILTTRQEHLNIMFGDFSSAFYNFSVKHGTIQQATLIEIEQWDMEQVTEFIGLIDIATLNRSENQRLQEFNRLVMSGDYLNVYGELPHNPLLLQFILEEVIEQGVQKRERADLIRSWVGMKIRRDRNAAKRIGQSELDLESFVQRMLTLMENIAAKMVIINNGQWQLVETISVEEVEEEAKTLFGRQPKQALIIALNSLLMSHSASQNQNDRYSFVFRIIQEYFIAAYLVRERNNSILLYPASVQEFAKEINSKKPIIK